MSDAVQMHNERVSDADADRQQATATEILRRFDEQPGVILADEVGMGKTYVALAVAVSVLEATRKRKPVVVMVPAGVADKWPTEWEVFRERCLRSDLGLRASPPIRRGSEFLKLLDDPADRRNHLIFLTHGALTNNLNDPFIKLALFRRALHKRWNADGTRRAVARAASSLVGDRRFREDVAAELLANPFSKWRDIWNAWRPGSLCHDDPVPYVLEKALQYVDLNLLYEALRAVPIRQSARYLERVRAVRARLQPILQEVWRDSLQSLDVRLPLLILDEAHHLKNANQFSRLFANEEAEADAAALTGPLGNRFERMLFLTATPFQLGHHELLNVLDRFHGIKWPSQTMRREFDAQLEDLRSCLDRAQASALRLERAWARIDSGEAPVVEKIETLDDRDELPEAVRSALTLAAAARDDIADAEVVLRPWVIRHTKADKDERRSCRPGRMILDDQPSNLGLAVEGAATLPFLLAARAQSIAALDRSDGSPANAFYAYGLASSFEAYADTRRNRSSLLDDQVGDVEPRREVSPQLAWYLDRIEAALPTDENVGWASHPKVAATVQRVVDLWRKGEKALVFCFYIETGKALRVHISRAVSAEITRAAAPALGFAGDDQESVFANLGLQADRLLRADSTGYLEFRRRVTKLTTELDDDVREQVLDIATRFMRTPSFLVRFVDLSRQIPVEALLDGVDRPDGSGLTLADRIEALAVSLGRSVETERSELIAALLAIQTGTISTTVDALDPSELSANREALLANVRLANGGVRQETRRRLMLGFNAPFFPEVLVASSVMAEGVDLHQACRYVIHHDLDWNPSTLEQRTGRVDRIGSKAERSGLPVVIYEPFVGGTHDEKMYRVVKDRERWFGAVMGGSQSRDERTTEDAEDQIPMPSWLAETMGIDLSTAL